MNEERQVMSRPNAARAQGDGLGRAADSGLMNGVSEPTPPVNSMNMDGETVPRVTSLSGTGVASGQDTSSAPPGPSSVDVAPSAVTATGTSSANSARGFLMGPDSRNSVEEVPVSSSSVTAAGVRRGPPAFLSGVAKAVQAIPAAVEGLVLGHPQGTTGGLRTAEVDGYVSAQSGSPDRRPPPPMEGTSSTPLLDEQTLRTLSGHQVSAPH